MNTIIVIPHYVNVQVCGLSREASVRKQDVHSHAMSI